MIIEMSFVNYKLIVTDSNGPMLEKYPIYNDRSQGLY